MRPSVAIVGLFLIMVSTLGLTPAGEKSYREATTELKQKGSVPLIATINRAKGRGPLKEVPGRKRIVGGKPADIHLRHWQVSLNAALATSNFDGHFCGGSIISENWILTAAHCVDRDTTPDQVDIVSGTQDLTVGGTRTPVQKIIIHNKYNPQKHDNDIALIKLMRPITTSSVAAPISPIDQIHELQLPLKKAIVSGWGAPKEDGDITNILMEAKVPIVTLIGDEKPQKVCTEPGAYTKDEITNNMLCAGLPNGKLDACQGDSGGPLAFSNGTDPYVLAGIVSWGDGCARVKKYGVYTRVAIYADWINAQMKANP